MTKLVFVGGGVLAALLGSGCGNEGTSTEGQPEEEAPSVRPADRGQTEAQRLADIARVAQDPQATDAERVLAATEAVREAVEGGEGEPSAYKPKTYEEIKAEVAERAARRRAARGGRPIMLNDTGPGLEVTDIDCTRGRSYNTVEGSVKNTGDVTVHFVRVDVRWLDASGATVDTDQTYAAGSEYLRPGESSMFRASSRAEDAVRCSASVANYRGVE